MKIIVPGGIHYVNNSGQFETCASLKQKLPSGFKIPLASSTVTARYSSTSIVTSESNEAKESGFLWDDDLADILDNNGLVTVSLLKYIVDYNNNIYNSTYNIYYKLVLWCNTIQQYQNNEPIYQDSYFAGYGSGLADSSSSLSLTISNNEFVHVGYWRIEEVSTTYKWAIGDTKVTSVLWNNATSTNPQPYGLGINSKQTITNLVWLYENGNQQHSTTINAELKWSNNYNEDIFDGNRELTEYPGLYVRVIEGPDHVTTISTTLSESVKDFYHTKTFKPGYAAYGKSTYSYSYPYVDVNGVHNKDVYCDVVTYDGWESDNSTDGLESHLTTYMGFIKPTDVTWKGKHSTETTIETYTKIVRIGPGESGDKYWSSYGYSPETKLWHYPDNIVDGLVSYEMISSPSDITLNINETRTVVWSLNKKTNQVWESDMATATDPKVEKVNVYHTITWDNKGVTSNTTKNKAVRVGDKMTILNWVDVADYVSDNIVKYVTTSVMKRDIKDSNGNIYSLPSNYIPQPIGTNYSMNITAHIKKINRYKYKSGLLKDISSSEFDVTSQELYWVGDNGYSVYDFSKDNKNANLFDSGSDTYDVPVNVFYQNRTIENYTENIKAISTISATIPYRSKAKVKVAAFVDEVVQYSGNQHANSNEASKRYHILNIGTDQINWSNAPNTGIYNNNFGGWDTTIKMPVTTYRGRVNPHENKYTNYTTIKDIIQNPALGWNLGFNNGGYSSIFLNQVDVNVHFESLAESIGPLTSRTTFSTTLD